MIDPPTVVLAASPEPHFTSQVSQPAVLARHGAEPTCIMELPVAVPVGTMVVFAGHHIGSLPGQTAAVAICTVTPGTVKVRDDP